MGAASTRVGEHVERLVIFPCAVGQDMQALGAADLPLVSGDRLHSDPVFGELVGPDPQDLPGTDEVQFLDPVEDEDPDAQRRVP